MKRDLIMGLVAAILSVLLLVGIIYGCCIGNWTAVPMCFLALTLNTANAMSRLRAYKYHKDSIRFQQSLRDFEEALNACWPDNKPDDDNRITD